MKEGDFRKEASGRYVFERDALYALPALLGELLDESPLVLSSQRPLSSADAVAEDGSGRLWQFAIKASSSPGVIRDVGEHFRAVGPGAAIPVLVVPQMTPAGARAAEAECVNWLDLAGNARIRSRDLYVHVRGNAPRVGVRGRPSSPFAPRSARVTRALLLEPRRWWRQRDLVEATRLGDGAVSRIVRRLAEERLLELDGGHLRPRDPGLLLDAWQVAYRPDRHDRIPAHVSGVGMDLAHELSRRLGAARVEHAFTGFPAAWLLDAHVSFRLVSVYVVGDPRQVISEIGARPAQGGANVEVVGPNDDDVFTGGRELDGLRCVAPVQVYLDLGGLPERSAEAASELRRRLLWPVADG